jgi:hypothetical protein
MLFAACALFAGVNRASAADSSGLTVFLPGGDDISGWNVVSAAERDATDEKGLYDTYDGAVEGMQKLGICYAHQRMFRNSSGKIVTIDIYTLYTWQHAKAYYVAQKNAMKSMTNFRTWQITQEACAAQGAGTTTAYVWGKLYAACVTVQGGSGADLTTARAFVTTISNKIRTYKDR